MDHTIISKHRLGDMFVIYRQKKNNPAVELVVIPWAMRNKILSRREYLPDTDPAINNLPAKWKPVKADPVVDSLVQVRIQGDRPCGGYCTGLTMRNSPDLVNLIFNKQTVINKANCKIIRTYLNRDGLFSCVHELVKYNNEDGLRVSSSIRNISGKSIVVEMLSSISIGGITPFAHDDAIGRLDVYRYRSSWSSEGRPLVESIESMNLERSWMGCGVRCERFGQVGSFPVNKWFPQIGIEDKVAGVSWGIQVNTMSSWQIELFRMGDSISLSGGIADYDFGHWSKVLYPGDKLHSPESRLTTAIGGGDSVAFRLANMQRNALDKNPNVENDLPIIFNDWCTSWGSPSSSQILNIANKIKDLGIKYLVIDANWSIRGDWVIDKEKFPNGILDVSSKIREQGMIPGIWFEFEIAASNAENFSRTDNVLKKNGFPLNVADRHFWDFRDEWALNFLTDKLIKFLIKNKIGYLKIDYNASIGIGIDGEESPGEELRQHLIHVKKFILKIKKSIPDLVIENCSSGGHRLVPELQEICSMGVFSDAHECVELPIIAANLHRHILPCQSQVWAVLRHTDSLKRIIYSLSALFLGRAALSGDILDLCDHQLSVLRRAIEFYKSVTTIIKNGSTEIIQQIGSSYRKPEGYQVVIMRLNDPNRLLCIVHRFGGSGSDRITFNMCDHYKIVEQFSEPNVTFESDGCLGTVKNIDNYSAAVFLLREI